MTAEPLPIWERHAWQLLTPCTEGWKCSKCSTVSPVATKVESCAGPAVSGPPHRLAWWSCARPVWLFVWPDGQQQSVRADPDEHLQQDRYSELVRRHARWGAPAPLRVAWLDRRLLAQRTLDDGPLPISTEPTPSTWLPPNAAPAEPPASVHISALVDQWMRRFALRYRLAHLDEERPEIGPDNAKPMTGGRT